MEIGKLVRELLLDRYRASKPLREVALDPATFPDLTDWVPNYMTYEIA